MTGVDEEERDDMRQRIARGFIEALPQARELGMRLEEARTWRAAVARETSPRSLEHAGRDPHSGAPWKAQENTSPAEDGPIARRAG